MTAYLSKWISSGRNGLWAVLLLFCALVAFSWVGFIASDDVTYARGAYGWIEQFPYVGGHGTIRYPITIPMAVSFLTFGGNEFAMALPSLVYMLAYLALVWQVTRDVSGTMSATIALAVIAITPLMVIQSSIASVDIVEMTFLFASVLLFWRCLDQGPDARRLFTAGAMAGLAFLTRETAVFIVPFYAILFLIGHRFHRGHYLIIAAGFLAVWAIEVLYLWSMTGDPFYRINISLHHDSTIDRSIDVAGNIIAHPIIDPFLVLLFNQEFMALFLIAIPSGLWLSFSRNIDARTQHYVRILILFGLIWFFCVGAAQNLLPLNPRYFMITAAVACIITGIALAMLITSASPAWRRLGITAALLLLGGNLVGIYVENKDNVFGTEQLAAIAAAHPNDLIGTDPLTRYRSDMLLKWAQVQDRVHSRPPQDGMLYVYNSIYANSANARMSSAMLPHYQPKPDWIVVARYSLKPSLMAKLLEKSGLSRRLPSGVWHKLRYRHPDVILYRVVTKDPE